MAGIFGDSGGLLAEAPEHNLLFTRRERVLRVQKPVNDLRLHVGRLFHLLGGVFLARSKNCRLLVNVGVTCVAQRFS